VGRGVIVGTGVGVGTLTRSLPTEHPRLPTNIITSKKLDTDLSLVNKLSILPRPSTDCCRPTATVTPTPFGAGAIVQR
jgi:hypothetical protein